MASLNYLLSLLLILAAACLAEIVNLRSPPSQSAQSRALINRLDPHTTYSAERKPDVLQDSELLDIVLAASVDGKFHAINRKSGRLLWSMSSFPTTTSVSAPSSLSPLVRTQHTDFDADEMDETNPQEMYIIEPQSGDIYVMTGPNGPLQRFPFSMAELVDMSPFTAPGDDERRVFIGRKETSLMLLELETGKIKATLNSECPSYHFEEEKEEIDLDELEDKDLQISSPTEVFIGRTDYYISIITQSSHHSPGAPRPPVQNLSFSTYGPNNKDNILQSSYRKTKDDAYIQTFPNGDIISFKARSDGQQDNNGLWAYNFNSPIVAIFDVLSGPSPLQHHPHTFVLLQPRPRLQDVLPNLGQNVRLPNAGSAYVGMIEETGSLYAMSPSHFPLVVFGGSDKSNRGRLIEAPRPRGSHDDGIHDLNSERNRAAQRIKCEDNPSNRRCLVGLHRLDDRDGDGHESRMKRLLEGPKSGSEYHTLRPGQGQWLDHGVDVVRNIDPPMPNGSDVILPAIIGDRWADRWEAALVTLIFGVLSLWLLFKRIKHKANLKVEEVLVKKDVVVPSPVLVEIEEIPSAVPEEMPQQASLSDSRGVVKEPSTPAVDEGDESDREGEGESEQAAVPGRRKGRRGKRGKKKKSTKEAEEEEKKATGSPLVAGIANIEANGIADSWVQLTPPISPPLQSSLVITSSTKPVASQPSLIVSDTVLGFGSHGTVVFQGSLQGRAVAVKRLLQDFVTLASREVSILQESDDHPNVIRYYYQEAHANFLYIALELCPASLADIIECPDREQFRDIAISFDPKKALKQITSGLRHLHALKLVHRDIKPQNILVSSAKGSSGGRPTYRMLISDFGLCKKLDIDQTSFLPTANGGMAAGTVGWRAPEILRGEVKLDDVSDDHSMSSRGSVATVNGSSSTPTTGKQTRLTKSVDIFALGCLFYYTLTNGGHPFGDRFEREVNILKNSKNLESLERFGEEGTEACDLINEMLNPEAYGRPDTTSCLLHPFFWDSGRRLNFLQDASDRFEIMCRDPKDPNLLVLEKEAVQIVGNDWHLRLDKVFNENLGKFRKYDGRSVQDLLRALRNKKHHYQDLPDNVKRHLGPMPEGFLAYFTRRYPRLFLHVHSVIKDTALRTESMFRTYFELPE